MAFKKILCRGLKFSKISSWKKLIEVMWLSWAWRRIFRFSGQVLINRDILDLQVLMRQNEVWNENPKTVFEQIRLSECNTFHKNNNRKKTWISNKMICSKYLLLYIYLYPTLNVNWDWVYKLGQPIFYCLIF